MDQARIRELVPHTGTMCLLDSVIHWDERSITCTATSHRASDHPLRNTGHLSALHLAEYGAQATAVHGGLLASAEGKRAPAGLLTALRDVEFLVPRVDDISAPLEVRATRLIANAGGWLYQFEIFAETQLLSRGRVAVNAIELSRKQI